MYKIVVFGYLPPILLLSNLEKLIFIAASEWALSRIITVDLAITELYLKRSACAMA